MSDTNESMIEHQHNAPKLKPVVIDRSFADLVPDWDIAQRHIAVKCIEDKLQLKGIPLSTEQYNEIADLFAVNRLLGE